MANINIGQLIENNAVDSQYKPYPNIDAAYGPYDSLAIANVNITPARRSIGLTVGIKSGNSISEYWYKGGLEDSNLVLKQVSVDLNNYYTKSQIDGKFSSQTSAIKEVSDALQNTNQRVDVLEQSAGYLSPYTRAGIKKFHVKVSNLIIEGVMPDPAGVVVSPLKYGINNVVSFTTDDANATTLSVLWASFNKRPITLSQGSGAASTYYYHAEQYLAGDIPAEIISKTNARFFAFYDVFKVPRRFKQGVAIWPYAGNKDGYLMDKKSVINPSAGNLYRFMTPYLMWEDCELLKRYGVDFYWHNIGTEDYGTDKIVENVIQGLTADYQKTKAKIGVDLKILARPDGNNTFLEAMQEMPRVDCAVAENSPAETYYPYQGTDMYHKSWMRIFQDNKDTLKAKLTSIVNNTDTSTKEWFHFCAHSVGGTWVDFCEWILNEYGGSPYNVSDIWFTTAGELYEYIYMRSNCKISNFRMTQAGNYTIEFDIDIPYKDNFRYKDITLEVNNLTFLTSTSATIEAVDTYTNEAPPQLKLAINARGKLYIQLGFEQSYVENAEFFINKYRETGATIWKQDAELEIQGFREDLKAEYQRVIDNITTPIPITGLSLSTNTLTITNREAGTVTLTATPANNTHMNDIVVSAKYPDSITVTKSVESGNVVEYTIASKGDVAIDNEITFSVDGQSATLTVYVDEVFIELTSLDVTPTELNFIGSQSQILRVVGSPDNNTEMGLITIADLNKERSWSISNEITGNTKTFTITNLMVTPGDYTGNFTILAKEGVPSKTIPYSLTIVDTPIDVPITEGQLDGPSTGTVGTPAHVVLTCSPTNNTQMDLLTVTPNSSNCTISSKMINKNVLSFDCNFTAAGSYSIVINNPVTTDSWTQQISVSGGGSSSEDEKTVCFVLWGLNELNKARKYNDTLYGGWVNQGESNYESLIDRTPVINKAGNTMSGWERACQVVSTLIGTAGLTQAGKWSYSSNLAGDLSTVFSINSETQVEYRYLYSYTEDQSNGWAVKVPNGNYKVRILTSSLSTSDVYSNFSDFRLNGTSILSQLPTFSLTNNTEWTQYFDVNVTDGIIWFYSAVPFRKRCGWNAIEIVKVE